MDSWTNLDIFLDLKIKRNSLWYATGNHVKRFYVPFNNWFCSNIVIVWGKKVNAITLTVTLSYNVRQNIRAKVNELMKMERDQENNNEK